VAERVLKFFQAREQLALAPFLAGKEFREELRRIAKLLNADAQLMPRGGIELRQPLALLLHLAATVRQFLDGEGFDRAATRKPHRLALVHGPRTRLDPGCELEHQRA